MSRPLRIEFPGATYHVASRGDRWHTSRGHNNVGSDTVLKVKPIPQKMGIKREYIRDVGGDREVAVLKIQTSLGRINKSA